MQVGFVRKCNQLPPHSSFVGSRWQSVDNPKSLIRPLWRRKLPALSYIWVNEFQNPTLSHLKIHKAHSFFAKSIDFSSRARNAYAHPTEFCIFCCHKCHTNHEKERKKYDNFNALYSASHNMILGRYITTLLKNAQNTPKRPNSNDLPKNCDTCDSKKAKTLVKRARVRTRESRLLQVFLQFTFLSSLSPPSPHSLKNDTSLS